MSDTTNKTIAWFDFTTFNRNSNDTVTAYAVNHPTEGKLIVLKGVESEEIIEALLEADFYFDDAGFITGNVKGANIVIRDNFPGAYLTHRSLSDFDLTEEYLALTMPTPQEEAITEEPVVKVAEEPVAQVETETLVSEETIKPLDGLDILKLLQERSAPTLDDQTLHPMLRYLNNSAKPVENNEDGLKTFTLPIPDLANKSLIDFLEAKGSPIRMGDNKTAYHIITANSNSQIVVEKRSPMPSVIQFYSADSIEALPSFMAKPIPELVANTNEFFNTFDRNKPWYSVEKLNNESSFDYGVQLYSDLAFARDSATKEAIASGSPVVFSVINADTKNTLVLSGEDTFGQVVPWRLYNLFPDNTNEVKALIISNQDEVSQLINTQSLVRQDSFLKMVETLGYDSLIIYTPDNNFTTSEQITYFPELVVINRDTLSVAQSDVYDPSTLISNDFTLIPGTGVNEHRMKLVHNKSGRELNTRPFETRSKENTPWFNNIYDASYAIEENITAWKAEAEKQNKPAEEAFAFDETNISKADAIDLVQSRYDTTFEEAEKLLNDSPKVTVNATTQYPSQQLMEQIESQIGNKSSPIQDSMFDDMGMSFVNPNSQLEVTKQARVAQENRDAAAAALAELNANQLEAYKKSGNLVKPFDSVVDSPWVPEDTNVDFYEKDGIYLNDYFLERLNDIRGTLVEKEVYSTKMLIEYLKADIEVDFVNEFTAYLKSKNAILEGVISPVILNNDTKRVAEFENKHFNIQPEEVNDYEHTEEDEKNVREIIENEASKEGADLYQPFTTVTDSPWVPSDTDLKAFSDANIDLDEFFLDRMNRTREKLNENSIYSTDSLNQDITRLLLEDIGAEAEVNFLQDLQQYVESKSNILAATEERFLDLADVRIVADFEMMNFNIEREANPNRETVGELLQNAIETTESIASDISSVVSTAETAIAFNEPFKSITDSPWIPSDTDLDIFLTDFIDLDAYFLDRLNEIRSKMEADELIAVPSSDLSFITSLSEYIESKSSMLNDPRERDFDDPDRNIALAFENSYIADRNAPNDFEYADAEKKKVNEILSYYAVNPSQLMSEPFNSIAESPWVPSDLDFEPFTDNRIYLNAYFLTRLNAIRQRMVDEEIISLTSKELGFITDLSDYIESKTSILNDPEERANDDPDQMIAVQFESKYINLAKPFASVIDSPWISSDTDLDAFKADGVDLDGTFLERMNDFRARLALNDFFSTEDFKDPENLEKIATIDPQDEMNFVANLSDYVQRKSKILALDTPPSEEDVDAMSVETFEDLYMSIARSMSVSEEDIDSVRSNKISMRENANNQILFTGEGLPLIFNDLMGNSLGIGARYFQTVNELNVPSTAAVEAIKVAHKLDREGVIDLEDLITQEFDFKIGGEFIYNNNRHTVDLVEFPENPTDNINVSVTEHINLNGRPETLVFHNLTPEDMGTIFDLRINNLNQAIENIKNNLNPNEEESLKETAQVEVDNDEDLDEAALNQAEVNVKPAEEEKDLFESRDELSLDVTDILDRYEDEDNTYDLLSQMRDELKPHGYTFDYGLDSSPYNLRKIEAKQKEKTVKGDVLSAAPSLSLVKNVDDQANTPELIIKFGQPLEYIGINQNGSPLYETIFRQRYILNKEDGSLETEAHIYNQGHWSSQFVSRQDDFKLVGEISSQQEREEQIGNVYSIFSNSKIIPDESKPSPIIPELTDHERSVFYDLIFEAFAAQDRIEAFKASDKSDPFTLKSLTARRDDQLMYLSDFMQKYGYEMDDEGYQNIYQRHSDRKTEQDATIARMVGLFSEINAVEDKLIASGQSPYDPEYLLQITQEEAAFLNPAYAQRLLKSFAFPNTIVDYKAQALFIAKYYGTEAEVNQVVEALNNKNELKEVATSLYEKYEVQRLKIEVPFLLTRESEEEGARFVNDAQNFKLLEHYATTVFNVDDIEITPELLAQYRENSADADYFLAENFNLPRASALVLETRIVDILNQQKLEVYKASDTYEREAQIVTLLVRIPFSDNASVQDIFTERTDLTNTVIAVISTGLGEIKVTGIDQTDLTTSYKLDKGKFKVTVSYHPEEPSSDMIIHTFYYPELPSAEQVYTSVRLFTAPFITDIVVVDTPSAGELITDGYMSTTDIAKDIRMSIKDDIEDDLLPKGLKLSVRNAGRSHGYIYMDIKALPDDFILYTQEYAQWHALNTDSRWTNPTDRPTKFTKEGQALVNRLHRHLNSYDTQNYHNFTMTDVDESELKKALMAFGNTNRTEQFFDSIKVDAEDRGLNPNSGLIMYYDGQYSEDVTRFAQLYVSQDLSEAEILLSDNGKLGGYVGTAEQLAPAIPHFSDWIETGDLASLRKGNFLLPEECKTLPLDPAIDELTAENLSFELAATKQSTVRELLEAAMAENTPGLTNNTDYNVIQMPDNYIPASDTQENEVEVTVSYVFDNAFFEDYSADSKSRRIVAMDNHYDDGSYISFHSFLSTDSAGFVISQIPANGKPISMLVDIKGINDYGNVLIETPVGTSYREALLMFGEKFEEIVEPVMASVSDHDSRVIALQLLKHIEESTSFEFTSQYLDADLRKELDNEAGRFLEETVSALPADIDYVKDRVALDDVDGGGNKSSFEIFTSENGIYSFGFYVNNDLKALIMQGDDEKATGKNEPFVARFLNESRILDYISLETIYSFLRFQKIEIDEDTVNRIMILKPQPNTVEPLSEENNIIEELPSNIFISQHLSRNEATGDTITVVKIPEGLTDNARSTMIDRALALGGSLHTGGGALSDGLHFGDEAITKELSEILNVPIISDNEASRIHAKAIETNDTSLPASFINKLEGAGFIRSVDVEDRFVLPMNGGQTFYVNVERILGRNDLNFNAVYKNGKFKEKYGIDTITLDTPADVIISTIKERVAEHSEKAQIDQVDRSKLTDDFEYDMGVLLAQPINITHMNNQFIVSGNTFKIRNTLTALGAKFSKPNSDFNEPHWTFSSNPIRPLSLMIASVTDNTVPTRIKDEDVELIYGFNEEENKFTISFLAENETTQAVLFSSSELQSLKTEPAKIISDGTRARITERNRGIIYGTNGTAGTATERDLLGANATQGFGDGAQQLGNESIIGRNQILPSESRDSVLPREVENSAAATEQQAPEATPPSAGNTEGNPEANNGETDTVDSTTDREADPSELFNLTKALNEKEYSPNARFTANTEALTLIQEVLNSPRELTLPERNKLATFTGMGAGVFNQNNTNNPFTGTNSNYGSPSKNLQNVINRLNATTRKSLKETTLTGFYTPQEIVDFMWKSVIKMGLDTSNKYTILDPAVGTGNYIGFAPEEIRNNSLITGIEKDEVTALIADNLYPEARIINKPFEKTFFTGNTYDVVIGNPPYGNFTVNDPIDNQNKLVHDYFLLDSIRLLKPGGILPFVTSAGTLDKRGEKIRRQIYASSDLVSAFRLPSSGFEKEADTSVVTDILFFRKRLDGEAPLGDSWLKTSAVEFEREIEMTDDEEIITQLRINDYFAENPQFVFGDVMVTTNQFGQTTTVKENETPLRKHLEYALENFIPKNIFNPTKSSRSVENGAAAKIIIDDLKNNLGEDFRVGNLVIHENQPHIISFDFNEDKHYLMPHKHRESDLPKIKDFILMRDSLKKLLAAENSDQSDTSELFINKQRLRLNDLYDNFKNTHGFISEKKNLGDFTVDPDAYLIAGLENYNRKSNTAIKADILRGRVVKLNVDPIINSTNEATLATVSKYGYVDVEEAASLADLSTEDYLEEEKDNVYLNPLTGIYEIAQVYLSGQIREKIKIANQALESDPSLVKNVAALEAKIPKKIDFQDINIKIGCTWIPLDTYNEYLWDKLNMNYSGDREKIYVLHDQQSNTWTLKATGVAKGAKPHLQNSLLGTSDASFLKLFELALEQRKPSVYIDSGDGKGQRVLDQERTSMAKYKQREIETDFLEFLSSDPERRNLIETIYNETYNCWVEPVFSGNNFTYPNITKTYKGKDFKFLDHQPPAIERTLLSEHGTLLAHEAGAGKTIAMGGISIKGNELGIFNCPMLVTPNHMLVQFSGDVLELFPAKKILVITKDDIQPVNRQHFLAKIIMNKWDAVVCTHSVFQRIGMSPSVTQRYLEDEIQQYQDVLIEPNIDRLAKKEIERQIKNIQAKVTQAIVNVTKDQEDNIYFDQLPVDAVLYDEAQYLKNFAFPTKVTNISGVPKQTSGRALDAMMKFDYIREKRGDEKGVVLASGTPISNSVAELYVMLRLSAPKLLRDANLSHFDNFVATFCESVSALEIKPDGSGYRINERLMFHNVPELLKLFRIVTDVKMGKDLNIPRPELNKIYAPAPTNDDMQSMMNWLAARTSNCQQRLYPMDIDNRLLLQNTGLMGSIDLRLIDPTLPDYPDSKVNLCVNTVFDIWEDTKEDRKTQLIFLDKGVPGGASFNLYQDMKDKWIAKGIPADEIAFIHDAKSDDDKEALFEALRQGDKRICIASTQKMGVGTNVQRLLTDVHLLDIPWRAIDIEQRIKRGHRNGNLNDSVNARYYTSQESFDLYSLNVVEIKEKSLTQAFSDPNCAARSLDENFDPTYAELMGITTNSEEIKRKVSVDSRIEELSIEKNAFTKSQFDAKYGVERNELFIKNRFEILAEIAQVEDDIKNFERDKFIITIDDLPIDDKKEMIFGIKRKLDKLTPYRPQVTIGSYLGYDLEAKGNLMGNTIVELKAPFKLSFQLTKNIAYDLNKLQQKFSNFLDCKFAVNDEIVRLQEEIKSIQSKPLVFPHNAELSALIEEQTVLEIEINKLLAEQSLSGTNYLFTHPFAEKIGYAEKMIEKLTNRDLKVEMKKAKLVNKNIKFSEEDIESLRKGIHQSWTLQIGMFVDKELDMQANDQSNVIDLNNIEMDTTEIKDLFESDATDRKNAPSHTR